MAAVRRGHPFPCRLSSLYYLGRWLLPGCTGRGGFSLPGWLTCRQASAYITVIGHAAAFGATARLRSSSLIFGDKASDPNRRRRSSTALRHTGGWGPPRSPGCLIGESEERETWTAESLRAASSIEDLSSIVVRPDETSAVDVSGQHPGPRKRQGACDAQSRVPGHAREPEWDLVKRCDQPGKVLIQLESLILAQSERWRQA